MEEIKNYLFRLICGAMLCGLVLSLNSPTGASGALRKRLCGLFLAFLALSPLRDFDIGRITYIDPQLSDYAERYSADGAEQAKEAFARIIKEQSATYILNKAAEYSMQLDAEVDLDPETGVPVSVSLYGSPTPYEKEALTDYITNTLGVERSQIHWNP